MFSRHPISRKLRQIRHAVESPLGLDGVDLDEMVDALCTWAAGYPFIVELPAQDHGPMWRRFVVDCPALGCYSPWLALSFDNTDTGPEVLVVLPGKLARRGVALGWAVCIMDLQDDGVMVGVALPTTFKELHGLQGLLEMAYVATFSRANWPA